MNRLHVKSWLLLFLFIGASKALDPGAVSFKFKEIVTGTQTNFEIYLRMADFSKAHLEALERSDKDEHAVGHSFVLYEVYDKDMTRLGVAEGMAILADIRGRRQLKLSSTQNFVFKFDGFQITAAIDSNPYSPNAGYIIGGSQQYNGAWGTVSPHDGKDGMIGVLLEVYTTVMYDWTRDKKAP